MKTPILNFPERGRTDLWPDQIRVSVERPAVETSYSPDVEVGRTIPYFKESVPYPVGDIVKHHDLGGCVITGTYTYEMD